MRNKKYNLKPLYRKVNTKARVIGSNHDMGINYNRNKITNKIPTP